MRGQRERYSFWSSDCARDVDMRMNYCACAVSAMLDDWRGVDREALFAHIATCRVRSHSRVNAFEFGFNLRRLPMETGSGDVEV